MLGWQHGVQFVCLAFQNTMAAQIAGETIHHWSGIPVVEADGGAAARDPHKLSTNCQLLRWILIDEISMVSAKLLAEVDMRMRAIISEVNQIEEDHAQRSAAIRWLGRGRLRCFLAAGSS